jgi:hypothetical protein
VLIVIDDFNEMRADHRVDLCCAVATSASVQRRQFWPMQCMTSRAALSPYTAASNIRPKVSFLLCVSR